jgi:hypothetical protein
MLGHIFQSSPTGKWGESTKAAHRPSILKRGVAVDFDLRAVVRQIVGAKVTKTQIEYLEFDGEITRFPADSPNLLFLTERTSS